MVIIIGDNIYKKNENLKLVIVSGVLCFIVLISSIPISATINQNDPYQYHSYQTMTDLLQDLENEYPDIMKVTSIGKTYQGRDIWAVKLSDNVSMSEDESGVLFMGAHHGNEKPSYEILIFFIQYMVETYYKPNTDDDFDGQLNEDPIDGIDNDFDGLIDEDPSEDRVRDILNQTQVFLIPMVNPDGVAADTRKNCAPNYGPFGHSKEITSYGVNLNRNYAYRWFLYYIFPRSYHLAMNMLDSSYNYRGEHPFSENETIAVKNFVESNDIVISLSYHSFGEFVFFPWTHTSKKTPDENLFISIGENITKIDNYYLYLGGDYIIPRYGGTLGTSENWLYGVRGILSYTIELCNQRAPTDPQVVYDVSLEHTGVNMYVCERSWTANPVIINSIN